MQCDICGKETKVFLTDMEGAKLYVCELCNPSGEGKISRPRPSYNNNTGSRPTNTNFKPKTSFVPQFKMRKQEPFDLSNYDLVENYAEQIKALREAKHKTFEEFAKDLFVTASYLQNVENDKLKPSAGLLLKLYEKYGLLLVNKIPGKEAPELPKKKFEFKPRPHFEKKKFDKSKFERSKGNFAGEKEEFVSTPKSVYVSENQQEQKYEPVSQNSKKKIILC